MDNQIIDKQVIARLNVIITIYQIPFQLSYHESERFVLDRLSQDSSLSKETQKICRVIAEKYPNAVYSPEFSLIKEVLEQTQLEEEAIPKPGTDVTIFVFRTFGQQIQMELEEILRLPLERNTRTIIQRLERVCKNIYQHYRDYEKVMQAEVLEYLRNAIEPTLLYFLDEEEGNRRVKHEPSGKKFAI